ncbi:MAG: gliding motility-associated C-terminal domain-containing protein [Bacteroidales bacterium]|nr:gliding motility-associated C-terminal domain-containing protein [Bacteroidales bacterium]
MGNLFKNTRKAIAITLSILFGLNVQAQVPTGHNLDFSTGGYINWSAKTGNYGSSSSNNAVFNWTSSWSDPTVPSDNGGKFFIVYDQSSGTDSYSGGQLPKVPPGYTHSSQINNSYGGTNCSQLEYTMEVTLENCLLTFKYSMILEAPNHSGYENPTFQIDVMKHNSANGAMLNELVAPCAFFENVGMTTLPQTQPEVWHTSPTSSAWIWSEWQEIKINLAKFVGDRITIRVRLGDCSFSAHGGYGYFTAKAEPALISTPGCAGYGGDIVTVASAPDGFDTYKWFEVSSTFLSQDELAVLDANSNSLSSERDLVVTEAMMGNAQEKFYAVKLVSPRTQTTRPNCVAYITTKILDVRPIFDNLTYIQATPTSPLGQTIFMVNDVQASAAPLYWQKYDFGDGTTPIEIEYRFDVNAYKWLPINADQNTATTFEYDATGSVERILHTYATHGTYTYTRTVRVSENFEDENAEYCEKSETLEVIVPKVPSLLLEGDDEICINTETTITASSPEDENTNNLTYQWWYSTQDITTEAPIFEGTQYTQLFTAETTFKVKVTNQETGFNRIEEFTVKVEPFPDITLSGATQLCMGEAANITATDATGATVAMQWSFVQPNENTVITNPSTSPVLTFTPTTDTTVYLLAQTAQGCFAWKSIDIYITNPIANISKTKICEGESVTLTGSAAETYSWEADPADPALSHNNQSTSPVTVTPAQSTTYTMRGYGETGCFTERTVSVTVLPYPTPVISYSPGYVDVDDPTLALRDESLNSASSLWTFPDGSTSNARSLNHRFNDLSGEAVWIHLETANELGCSDTTSVTVPIELFAVWVPNAFTPNGDGVNDLFYFISLNQLEDVSFDIFNRYGERIHSAYAKTLDSSNQQEIIETFAWDGTYKGSKVPTGTYIYRLSYKRLGNTRVYDTTGTINVIQ